MSLDIAVDAFAPDTDGVAVSFVRQAGKVRPFAPSVRKGHKLRVRTVFISDVHLGSTDSKAREVVNFLKRVKCEKLVLNGDIIDAWALRRGGKWQNRHTKFVRHVLKMSEKQHTKPVGCVGIVVIELSDGEGIFHLRSGQIIQAAVDGVPQAGSQINQRRLWLILEIHIFSTNPHPRRHNSFQK